MASPLMGTPNTKGSDKIGQFLTNKLVYLGKPYLRNRDTAIVALEVEYETIPKLSNGDTFDDLE